MAFGYSISLSSGINFCFSYTHFLLYINHLEYITRVAPIVEKMVEFCFRWFGHVWRRLVEATIRRVDQMEGSSITRGRCKQKETIGKSIKKDLDFNDLSIDMVYDETLWRYLIHVVDSN